MQENVLVTIYRQRDEKCFKGLEHIVEVVPRVGPHSIGFQSSFVVYERTYALFLTFN